MFSIDQWMAEHGHFTLNAIVVPSEYPISIVESTCCEQEHDLSLSFDDDVPVQPKLSLPIFKH